MSLQAILKDIADRAQLPLDEAKSLPPAAYSSPELFGLEKQRIFRQDWLCVGRSDRLPNAGDYICTDLPNEPVFTIRSQSGELRTFANVCRHRGAVLLQGSGNARRITCPYHAWRYEADSGQLLQALHMERSRGFDAATIRLGQLRTEVWNGWIYITLNDEAQPLAERLSGLQELVGDYRMQDYRTVIQEEMTMRANWKCLTENFIDEYHPFMVHRHSLGREDEFLGIDEVEFKSSGVADHAWALHGETVHPATTKQAKRLFPEMPDLESRWEVLFAVFPSHTVFIGPGARMFSLAIYPKATDALAVRWSVSVPPGHSELTGTGAEDLRQLYAKVNGEDKEVVERVFQGLQSSHARSGPLSYRECSLWRFQKYLHSRLGDDG